MSALSIFPAFPVFTGLDGQPLDNGFIWIGQPNLDPQTNPAAVYWDEALSIAAHQPIRTLAGYPSRSGTPARIYVNSDYSIRVQDSKGSLVYSAPQATERISSDLVTFTQQGAGAVPRTVQSKLEESVSAKDFGAVGDGVADDSAAIQDALQYCSDTGTPFKASGGDIYRMVSDATINRTNGKPMLVDWAGATVVCDESSGVVFGNAPTAFLNTSLATEIDRGDAYIHLTSVTGISKGDLLEILSPALTSGSVSTYHYYVVNEIDGNNVYIEGTTVADVKAQQILDSGQTGSITVAAFKVAPTIVVQNAKFEITDTTGANNACLYVRGHEKAIVNNITFTGKSRFQLICDYTGFVDVGSCTFRDFGYVELNSGYTNLPSAPSGQSFGYGFLTTRNYETLFHDCFGLRGWHTIDVSRGAMKTQVSSCFFDRNAYGVATHEGSWLVSVRNCNFDGTTSVLAARAAYFIVENCDFRAMTENGVSYGGRMIEFRAANNRFLYNPAVASSQSAIYDSDNASPLTPEAGAVSTGFPRVFEMIGNTVIGQCRSWAGFSGSSASGRLSVNDNTFRDYVDFRVSAMLQTTIKGNEAFDVGGQFMFDLRCSDGNPTVVCANNRHGGGAATTAGGAMFKVSGSNTPNLLFDNNSCALQFLIRFDSNITVQNVLNCTNRSERLFLNAGTVTNAINNCYKISIATTTTVTNSVNNNVLS
jgi:hypothetical protein